MYHYLYSLLLEEKVEYSDFNYFSEDKKNPQNKHILDENISCAGTYRCVNVFTCKILYEMDYLISDVFFSLFQARESIGGYHSVWGDQREGQIYPGHYGAGDEG